MKTIRTIIVDDEIDAIIVLELLLKRNPNITVVGTAQSVNQGIELINELQPDLVLLDVEMPGKNGFELLNAFDQPSFKVIFVTAFDQYAIKAIKYSALDYLLKPINWEELQEAITRLIEQRLPQDERLAQLNLLVHQPRSFDRIIITSKKGFITLQLDEIISIASSSGNYAFFHMASGKQFVCTKPLSHYEELLSGSAFYRIHRSHVVNLDHISNFDNQGGEVLMSDHRRLPVAVRRRAEFKKRITEHFASHTNA